MKSNVLIIGSALAGALLAGRCEAATQRVIYTGQDITVKTALRCLTTVVFPEKILKVMRLAETRDYEFRQGTADSLLVMPFADKDAQVIVIGASGENYAVKLKIGPETERDAKVVLTLLKNGPEIKNAVVTFSDRNPPEMGVNPPRAVKEQTSLDSPLKKVTPEDTDIFRSLPAELNQKITLKGCRLPLKVYFNAMEKATGYNLISNKEIDDTRASLNVTDMEIWRALKTLLYPLAFGFKLNNGDIVILSSETRIYEVPVPDIAHSFDDTTSNESFIEAGQKNTGGGNNPDSQGQDVKVGTKIFVESKTKPVSVWADLEDNLKKMVSPTGVYTLNPSSGVVVVKDLPGVLDRVGKFMDQLAKNITRQQTFEIQIIEVALTDEYEMGVDWTALAKNFGGLNHISAVTNFAASGFNGGKMFTLNSVGKNADSGTTSGGVDAVIKALAEMGKVKVISRPTLTASNLYTSVIQEGKSKTYISESGQTFNDNTTSTTVKTNQVHEGLTMRINARIGSKNEKSVLNLSAVVTTIDAIDNVKSGNVTIQTPQVSTKSIVTNVGVGENESLIIGGLISTTEQRTRRGVPLISAVPIFGSLFRYEVTKNNKTELVIIITPKPVVE
ncbi:MAG: hypothetical protein HQL23_05970 [Candidatus Omnitrophica bacterium]|nr:hypothetical protein [Candidatus Omnitrophota bacterium]